jgi:hypothetical protein
MDHDAMLGLFRSHRDAEAVRDLDAILATFVEDCYLDTVALGLRSQGRARRLELPTKPISSHFPILLPMTRDTRSAKTRSSAGGPSAEPAAETGSVSLPPVVLLRSGSSTSRRCEMSSWRARASTSTSRHCASKPACHSTSSGPRPRPRHKSESARPASQRKLMSSSLTP